MTDYNLDDRKILEQLEKEEKEYWDFLQELYNTDETLEDYLDLR